MLVTQKLKVTDLLARLTHNTLCSPQPAYLHSLLNFHTLTRCLCSANTNLLKFLFCTTFPSMVLVLQLLPSGTRSHVALTTLPLLILSVAFLKLTVSSRPSAPLSGSPKYLRFSHWLTSCTLNTHLLNYLKR